MRALQLLREGKLVWSAGPAGRSTTIEPLNPWPLHPITAKILVDRKLVELRRFTPRAGIYKLTKHGRELTRQLCECKYRGRWGRGTHNRPAHDFALLSGVDPITSAKVDWPKERLICQKCWRVARCEAKFFKQPHGANRFVWGTGPVCQFHVDNPTKR